jgi:hypothetical protein
MRRCDQLFSLVAMLVGVGGLHGILGIGSIGISLRAQIFGQSLVSSALVGGLLSLSSSQTFTP